VARKVSSILYIEVGPLWSKGGLGRVEGVGSPAALGLVAAGVEEGPAVAVAGLAGELEVDVLQLGGVRVARDRQQRDVLYAVGAPEPDIALQDRAADVEAVILDAVDLVAMYSLGGQIGGDIVILQALAGVVGAALTVEGVAALFGDEVQ